MTRAFAIMLLAVSPLVWIGAREYLSYAALLWPLALLFGLGLLLPILVHERRGQSLPMRTQVEVVSALVVGATLWIFVPLLSVSAFVVALVVMRIPNRTWALWALAPLAAALAIASSLHPLLDDVARSRPWLPMAHGSLLGALVLCYAIENRLCHPSAETASWRSP